MYCILKRAPVSSGPCAWSFMSAKLQTNTFFKRRTQCTRLCGKLSRKLRHILHPWGPTAPMTSVSKPSLWLMISPIGATGKAKQLLPGGSSPTWPPDTPFEKQLLACFWAFLDGWPLNIWQIEAIEFSSDSLIGGGRGLKSDSITNKEGRAEQASWSNGNGTSDILALHEKVAAISLGEEIFLKTWV